MWYPHVINSHESNNSFLSIEFTCLFDYMKYRSTWKSYLMLMKWHPNIVAFQRVYGPLARYIKLRVAHGPGMLRTFYPSPWVSDPGIQHSTFVTHVLCCMPWSLISGFLSGRWREKRSWPPRRMRNPQFYISGKRPMGEVYMIITYTCTHELNAPTFLCFIMTYWIYLRHLNDTSILSKSMLAAKCHLSLGCDLLLSRAVNRA